jgi:hypothetical protein
MAYKPDTIEGVLYFCANEGQPCESVRLAVAVIDALESAMEHYGPTFYERIGPSPTSRLLNALERYKAGVSE